MVACNKKEQTLSEKNRKSFTSQYKAKVALEAIRGIKTLNEIAQEFAVHPTQVGKWKKSLLAQAPGILTASAVPSPMIRLPAPSGSNRKSGG
jgi:transposase-like protein